MSQQPGPPILSLLSFQVLVSNSHKNESAGQAWIKCEQQGYDCAQGSGLHGSLATNLEKVGNEDSPVGDGGFSWIGICISLLGLP